MPALALIRGGGDLASGVALRLHRAGLRVVVTELAEPLAVRRTVSFAEAVYEGVSTVEDVSGRRLDDPADASSILSVLARGEIAVVVDPQCLSARTLHADVIVDGRMRKQPPENLAHEALIYVGLGPGFLAPENCDAVVETVRGHTLGRVIWKGHSLEDTKTPEGDARRVLRAPVRGPLISDAKIGDHFERGQLIAAVGEEPVLAPFAGLLRGLLRPGIVAEKGMKIGDIDARDDPRLCQLVSEKSLAVGGGALEAVLTRPAVRARLWA